ncbi:E3 SUMO-protein ligase RNF212, partial [Asbolus verrucosus]
PSKVCIICNKSGQVLPLNKDVEQNVLDFFLPVENHFKKTLEVSVYKFQVQHRSSLFQNLLEKYNYAKKEYMNCHNTNNQLIKENQMLRSMLRSASGKSSQRFMTSTPMSHSSDNMTFQNSSIMSSIPPHMGTTPSGNNHNLKMYPGYPKRNSQVCMLRKF